MGAARIRNKTINRVEELARYVRTFGAVAGMNNYICARSHKHRSVRLRHPQLAGTMLARGGTTDVFTFESVFLDHEYEFDLPFEPQVIVDAGANVGFATLDFLRRFPAARIIAIEPEASNCALLRRNLRDFANVDVVEGALWPRRANLRFVDPRAAKDAFRLEETGTAGPAVRGLTVPDIISQFDLARIDLFKIDIEGAEIELFSGDLRWLARVGAVAIELHERLRPGSALAFYRAMREHGFVSVGDGAVVVMVNRAHAPAS